MTDRVVHCEYCGEQLTCEGCGEEGKQLWRQLEENDSLRARLKRADAEVSELRRRLDAARAMWREHDGSPEEWRLWQSSVATGEASAPGASNG